MQQDMMGGPGGSNTQNVQLDYKINVTVTTPDNFSHTLKPALQYSFFKPGSQPQPSSTLPLACAIFH
jgi:hypothetical protein